MNTLVIYDSQFGNTEKIASRIAETLKEFGQARAERVNEFDPDVLANTDLLVLGSPTQAWHETPAVKEFISRLDQPTLSHLCVAEFDTVLDKPRFITGSAAKNMAKQLQRLGARTLVPPENFRVTASQGPLVEGELEHAAKWAHDLHNRFVGETRLQEALA